MISKENPSTVSEPGAPELNPAWRTEIERRDREIQAGKPVLKDSDQVFQDAFKQFESNR